MNALAIDESPADWSEERENVLFANMGNDEVGYATVARKPTLVSVRKSNIDTASDDGQREFEQVAGRETRGRMLLIVSTAWGAVIPSWRHGAHVAPLRTSNR